MSRINPRRRLKTELLEFADALRRDWDPIGAGVPRDEYDDYAAEILGLLKRGDSDARIAQHLTQLESEDMGLEPRSIEQLQRVVELLRRAVTSSAYRAT